MIHFPQREDSPVSPPYKIMGNYKEENMPKRADTRVTEHMGTFLAKILQWQINCLYNVKIILQLIGLCYYFGFSLSFSILSDGFQRFPVYSPFSNIDYDDVGIESKAFSESHWVKQL